MKCLICENKNTILILAIFILCIIIYLQKEGFHNPFYNPFYNPYYHQFYEHHFDPIYGYPTRMYPTRVFSPTRNMSYDLRGDPNVYYPLIPYGCVHSHRELKDTVRVGPWGESVILPQYRFREPLVI